MLHLFKKTYIQVDKFIDSSENRLVISQDMGTPDSRPSLGKLYQHTLTLEDLIGENKPFDSLYTMLESLSADNDKFDTRIVLYLDKTAFTKVVAAWFKIIFANATPADAWTLVESFFVRSKLLVSNSEKDYSLFLASEITYEEFKAAFDSFTVDEDRARAFVNNNLDKLSIEYLLSSYLFDTRCRSPLKKSLQFMINRQIEQTLIEAKFTIYRKIMKQPFKDKLGLQNYTLGNLSDIANEPAMRLLVDSSFCQASGKTAVGKDSSINLKNITEAEIEELDVLIGKVYPELEYKTYFKDYIRYVKKSELTDSDLDNILTNEKTTDEAFWSTIDLENINIYFIDYIMQPTTNKDLLLPFVLRT